MRTNHKTYRVFLKEQNRKSPVLIDTLESILNYTFEVTKKMGGNVSLVVCDNNFIAELNEKYKGRIGPTNVLSFPMREGQFPELNKEELPLGDIVISLDKIIEEADRFNDPVDLVFKYIFVHGILHLLGYTHNNEDDERYMDELTEKIINFK